jgi:hypothetical protein
MVVVIDEWASWAVDCGREKGAQFEHIVVGMSRIARAACCTLIILTQRPTHDVISTSLRSQLTWRWCMRVMSSGDSDVILSPGWAKKGYDASTLSQANPGEGYLRHEAANPVLCRAYELPDAELESVAARALEISLANAPASGPMGRASGGALARANGQVSGAKGPVSNGDGVNDENRQERLEGLEELGGSLDGRDWAVLVALVGRALTLTEIMALTDPPISRSRARALMKRLEARKFLNEPRPKEEGKGNASPFIYSVNVKGRDYVAKRSETAAPSQKETV